MNLNRFSKKLSIEKLSQQDYKVVNEVRKSLKNFIRDENLDEMRLDGKDYFTYSSKLKYRIQELTEDRKIENKEEVVNQLYNFFKLK